MDLLLQLVPRVHIKEEVREDLYMQAGLQVPYCCRPATYKEN
jgi:hypothetical protein